MTHPSEPQSAEARNASPPWWRGAWIQALSSRWPLLACGLLLAGLAPLGERAPASPSMAADTTRGKLLLSQFQCGACHRIPDVPNARGTLGPTLEAIGRRSYIAGELPNTRELRTRFIMNPPSLVPGTTMPMLGVSRDDAAAMADHLATLR